MLELVIRPHPLLCLSAFVARLPEADVPSESPSWLLALLRADAEAPMAPSEQTRLAARDLLRHGGFKPTGRSKPASEYLTRAATEGTLRSIHPLVDAGNVVSLHSGLPISVVDATRLVGPLSVHVAPEGSRAVFNAAGQTLDASKLLCLFDGEGPCANAVKDAQRTKLSPTSREGLWLIWGSQALADETARAATWARALLERLGATIEDIQRTPGTSS